MTRLSRVIDSAIVRQFTTLLAGNASVQLLGLLAMPILTRLFTPAEIGVWALYLAIVLTLGGLVALRLDLAMFSPTGKQRRESLIGAALLASIIVVALLSMIAVFAAIAWQGSAHAYGIGPVTVLCLVINVLLFGVFQLIQMVLNAEEKFASMSGMRVQQAVITSLLQVGTGIVGAGVEGLILGTLVGHALPVARQFPALGVRRRLLSFANLTEVLRHEWRMPVFNGTAALVDALRLNGINFVVAGFFSAYLLGMYSLAWRAVLSPSSAVSAAVGQVFLPRFRSAAPGQLHRPVLKCAAVSTVLGIVPFTALWLWGEELFSFVFGSAWLDAGRVASAISPYLFMAFITAPLSTVFVVTNRQAMALGFSVVYAVVPVGILVAARAGDFFGAFEVLGWTMAGLLVAYLALVGVVSRRDSRLVAVIQPRSPEGPST